MMTTKDFKLSKRLAAVAAFIPRDAGAVADVGTDHGYVPVYLALTGAAHKIIAADVREGPLARAVESAHFNGVFDKIEFIQTDGLEGLEGRGLDTVVMAGMGGETIVSILKRAPWTKEDKVRLILQPQSKSDSLFGWLSDNGYHIMDAVLVSDEGRLYTVLLAVAGVQDPRRGILEILADKRDALLPAYLDGCIKKTIRAISGLKKASDDRETALKAKKLVLDKLMRIKEETEA